jgi:hypothetical protein
MEKDTRDKIKYYSKRYLEELLQAFIGLSILYYVKDDKIFDIKVIIKNSLLLALVTFIVEEFIQLSIKGGMSFAIGNALINYC